MPKQQKQKIVQYLNEAHGSELALVRQLQAQITMTPRGWGHTDSCPQRPARSDRRHGLGRDSVAVAVEPKRSDPTLSKSGAAFLRIEEFV